MQKQYVKTEKCCENLQLRAYFCIKEESVKKS